MKNFIYMVQGEASRISGYLHLCNRPDADAIFLTYDRELEGCIFFPNSTFMQGRNRLLAEAKIRGDYCYFIFMDDDVEFVRGGYDEFESLLLQLRPAIGVPVYRCLHGSVVGFGSPFNRFFFPLLDWQIARGYDGQLNAYHRDLILDGLVIPYWESFADNWRVGDLISHTIGINFYPEVLQFNRIVVSNDMHRDYPTTTPELVKERAAQWMSAQFSRGYVKPIYPQLMLLKFIQRLLLPIKPRYFRRDVTNGIIGPIVNLREILKLTRAYRPRESYRADPQLVAKMLRADSPLYHQYLHHRAPD